MNPDVSDKELLLRKFDRRDMVQRAIQIGILLFLVVVTLFSLYRIQNVLDNNQSISTAARKQNFQRQEEIKGYIKCIILLRYDNVGLGPNSPRADVEKALDKCAISTIKE